MDVFCGTGTGGCGLGLTLCLLGGLLLFVFLLNWGYCLTDELGEVDDLDLMAGELNDLLHIGD